MLLRGDSKVINGHPYRFLYVIRTSGPRTSPNLSAFRELERRGDVLLTEAEPTPGESNRERAAVWVVAEKFEEVDTRFR